MTAAYIMSARADAWQRALAAYFRCGRVFPPEVFYEEPFPELPPDDELEDGCVYDEDGTEHKIS